MTVGGGEGPPGGRGRARERGVKVVVVVVEMLVVVIGGCVVIGGSKGDSVLLIVR